MQGQITMFDNGENYKAFTDKFIPAKTTDDCYTPENIYQVVAEWVARTYKRDPAGFVRPFWPGSDYERMDYPDGCTVVDNPPFSILASIVRHYTMRGIAFFLFAPALTLFCSLRANDITAIPVGASITYENGASVSTSFLTNLDADNSVLCAPELYRAIKAANDKNMAEKTKALPKYKYPPEALTAAAAFKFSHYGVNFSVRRGECRFFPYLSAQKKCGKSAFGGCLLLSERAAAECAAAERAAAERAAAERAAAERAVIVFELSETERRMSHEMGSGQPKQG